MLDTLFWNFEEIQVDDRNNENTDGEYQHPQHTVPGD